MVLGASEFATQDICVHLRHLEEASGWGVGPMQTVPDSLEKLLVLPLGMVTPF